MGLLSGYITPQATTFWKNARYCTTPTRSAPPVFDHGVQVFSSTDKHEPLAQHFERPHHLNLHVGTTNRACMVNRTFNNYSRRPTHTSLRLSSQTPYEIRRLIQSLSIKSATGTGGISATTVRNLSRKPLIKLTQLFNRILTFGYFPSAPF